MNVYISGPMTGKPDLNHPAFHAAAERLAAHGHEITNPVDCAVPAGSSWESYMREDIAMLVRCDAIYMLSGWHSSRGAVLEHYLALRLKMTILYQSEGLL